MYKHILIPIALDHEHTPAEALAVAGRLLAPGGRITTVHVMEPVPGYISQYLPEQSHEARVSEVKDKMAEALAGADVTTEVIQGAAGRAICDYANTQKVDLIVIASHQPGMQDYLLGSTAARVVRHAQCAVHVLR